MQPVVVFPGWYVAPFDMKGVGVWVLEPNGLDGFIERNLSLWTGPSESDGVSAVQLHTKSKRALTVRMHGGVLC